MIDKKTLSDIHARFRQLRSGELADNLAAQGINYRIAWGVESYKLREIASEFQQDKELAEALWKEDVRESKMLATRLYPINELSQETALAWVKEAKYTEIADQVCMNILSKMPNVKDIVVRLVEEGKLAETGHFSNSETSPIEIYTALKLATRNEIQSPEILSLAEKILSENYPIYLKTAALWYKQIYD